MRLLFYNPGIDMQPPQILHSPAVAIPERGTSAGIRGLPEETTKEFRKKNELDLEWLNEEETLQYMDSIPQPSALPKIRIEFLFADIHSEIRPGIKITQPLYIDVSRGVSILSKNTLLRHIETAKQQYTAAYSSSSQFSLIDILIWNVNVDSDHISRYANIHDPEWISPGFTHGSIFDDIVLSPSLFVFHSEQTIYVILREKPPQQQQPPQPSIRGILRNVATENATGVCNKKHTTKRVQFARNPLPKRTTRKST